MRRLVATLVALAHVACGAAQTPGPSASPASSAGRGPARAQTSRDRLVAELRRIERPSDVLAGLSAQARADIDRLLSSLSDQERHELAALQGPWPKVRPLLHLAAGGESPDAHYELAVSGRVGDELLAARRLAGGTGSSDLVASARAATERAAARWLRDRAVEAASPAKVTPALCDRIDRAAAVLRRGALRRRARELAAELEATSPRHAAVAIAAAWELDLAAARRARDAARAAAKTDADRSVLAVIESTLESAARAQATRGKTLGVDEAVAAARANLLLGRRSDALAAISPHAAKEGSHLGIATASAMAKVDQIVCPGMPPGASSPSLCAMSWAEDPRVRAANALVERAWNSGQGRDEQAIGAYLGLVHFVPWIYDTYLTATSATPEAFGERLERVRGPLRAAIAASSSFEGVLLFVDTLAGLYEAGKQKKPTERVHLDQEAQKKLVERATLLARKHPDHRFTHAAVLAVAAALAQERDVMPIIALLPSDVGPGYALPREVLRLWSAVGDRDAARLDQASGVITTLLNRDPSGIESAKLVLLMAEAGVAMGGSARELDVLSRIGTQLTSADLPTGLRLRAAIDRAGALARQGDRKQAEQTLETVLTTSSVQPASSDSDLAAIALAYLIVLRARETRGEERVEYRKKLDQVDESTGTLPASILAWRDSWLAEIDRLIAEDKCGAMKVCRDRAKKPGFDERELTTRVGAASAKVMQRGVLAAGTMQLNFAFSVEDGLIPIVVFEPRLLAVEPVPPR